MSTLDEVAVRFSKASSGAGKAIEIAMTRETLKLVAYVKKEKLQGQVLNQRSGKLNRSIAQRVTRKGTAIEGVVGSIKGHAPHARPLEEGSQPHMIRPVRAKALAFMGPSGMVFAGAVRHPGNRPYRYLRSSLTENRGLIVQALNKAALENI